MIIRLEASLNIANGSDILIDIRRWCEWNDLWRDTMSLVLRTHHNILKTKEQWNYIDKHFDACG